MNDEAASQEELPMVPWLRATFEDVASVNVEAPIAGSRTADCHELSDLYRAALAPTDGLTEPPDTAASRVFTTVTAVTGMYFKPQERNEPFGPMVIFADGRRSAIPSDFRSHVDMLAAIAERATNPVLRARFTDVCWLLERKRSALGIAAIAAYTEMIRQVDGGELKTRSANKQGALQHEIKDHLRRALQIGHAVGWERPETVAARDLVTALREKALAKGELVPIDWFTELDLDFGVSDPAEIGESLDGILAAAPSDAGLHNVVDLWRLAARAYHQAKRSDDENRCRTAAAEVLVASADAQQGSAMLASHLMSEAIAQLHGVSGARERRTTLRHRLVDIQAHLLDEMATFSQKIDLREIAEWAQSAVDKENLLDKLFAFAALEISPDPETLARDAAEAIREHPLSSLFAATHHDHEGKVTYRTSGSGLGDTTDNSALLQQIAHAEDIRRRLVAFGKVDAARRSILAQHFVADDVLGALLEHSPFVPPDLPGTFARGFTRFFQGDFTSATYILVPLLENSLRYVLKSKGHDVTIFVDATQTQQDRTISSIFERMRAELDETFGAAITTDLERVFLAQPGPTLRHAVAHGLMHDGTPHGADAIYACWLMFRLSLLPLFQHRDELRPMFEGTELCRE